MVPLSLEPRNAVRAAACGSVGLPKARPEENFDRAIVVTACVRAGIWGGGGGWGKNY